jgi:hypothetical protein
MIDFSHCQEKNKAHFVSRMGLNDCGLRIADCGFEKAKSAIENDLAPGFYILTS